MLIVIIAFIIFSFGIITRFFFKQNPVIQDYGLAALCFGAIAFFSLSFGGILFRSDVMYDSIVEKRDAIVDALEHAENPEAIAKAFSVEIQGLNVQVNESKKMRDNIFVGCLVNYDIGDLELIDVENYY